MEILLRVEQFYLSEKWIKLQSFIFQIKHLVFNLICLYTHCNLFYYVNPWNREHLLENNDARQ